MITVVLNVYKRLNSLETQIRRLKEQSVKPKKIFIWNNSGRAISVEDKNIIQSSSSFNLGVWARFAYALNAKTKYVAIFDDDTIPGRKWFENCLRTIQTNKGLLGARGVRFSSK
jgi:GT2 family glycosyltransferase